ncbi:sugar ABC transporter substrate-binding protein [Lacisediminihabitans profunda]|nr:substrate-binding domain-containing protein [Lacisediminihabitans profunda]
MRFTRRDTHALALIRRLAAVSATAILTAVIISGCSAATPDSPKSTPENASLNGQRLGISVCCAVPQIDTIANGITDNVKKNRTGLTATVVNGQSSTQKAKTDVQTFLAQDFDAIWTTLISGQGYDSLAREAADRGIPWVNFSGSAVTGATLNIVIPEEQLGYVLGTATAKWMADHDLKGASIGATIDSTGANVARTEGFIAGVKATLPKVTVFKVGNAASTSTAGQSIGANLLQAHPDIKIFFGWTADDAVGLLSAAKQAGYSNPDDFLVVSPEANDQIFKLIGSKSLLGLGASLGYPFGVIAGENLLEKALHGKTIPTTAIMRPTVVTAKNVELVQKQEANPSDYPDRIENQLAFVDQVLKFGDAPTEQIEAAKP